MVDFKKNFAWDQSIAKYFAQLLSVIPIHPNVITTVGWILGIFSGYLFAQGDPYLANYAAVIFIIAAFLDHVDGEFARIVEKTSDFGHYYDHFAVCITYVSLFIGIGIGKSYGVLGNNAIFFGFAASIAIAITMSIRLYKEIRDGKLSIQQGNFLGFEPEDTLYIVGPIAWLDGLTPFLIAAGIGAPIFLLWVIWDFFRSGMD